MTPLKILTKKTLSPGRAGLLASEAGPQGCGSLLVGGGAREEPQEEQAHPPQPKRHAGKGKSLISLSFKSVCVVARKTRVPSPLRSIFQVNHHDNT